MPLSAPYAIFNFEDTGPAAVSAHTGYVYVSNGRETTIDALHRITIYDPSRGRVVGFIDGISGPMVYGPAHDELYVATGDDLAIVDCTLNAIVATLHGVAPSGWSPGAVALDALDGLVYVVYNNRLDGTLAVVSVSTRTVVGRVDGLWHSNGIAWNPQHNEIYVTGDAAHKIAVIDPSDNRIVTVVEGVFGPQGIVYDPLDDSMYSPYFDGSYVNENGQSTIVWQAGVARINGATHRVVGNITGFHAGWDGPTGIEFNPHDGNLYVANGTAVIALNGASGAWLGPVWRFSEYYGQTDPGPLTYNPVDYGVYASAGDGIVAIGSTRGIYDIGYDFSNPVGVAYDPARGIVYAANQGTSSVVQIDAQTHRLVGALDGFGRPDSVTYNPDVDALVVGNEANNSLSFVSLNTNRTFATIAGVFPWDVLYDSRSRNLFVGTNRSLMVIPGAMKGTFTNITGHGSLLPLAVDSVHGRVFARSSFYVPNGPYLLAFDTQDNSVLWNATVSDTEINSLAYDPHHGNLYAGLGSTGVAVINASTGTIIATIGGPFEPVSVVFDPANEYVYVADHGKLWVIDSSTNKVVQTIDLPGQPNQMVYDPDSQEIYISCGTASSRTGFVVAVPSMQYPTPPSPIPLGLIEFGVASVIAVAAWLVIRRLRNRARHVEPTRPEQPDGPKDPP